MRALMNGLSKKPVKSKEFSGFLGVDFSSPMTVSPKRAAWMRNLISDHGVNRKRHGWRQVAKLPGRINGIFEYVNKDRHDIIVYAGTRFYRQNGEEFEDITASSDYADANIDTSLLKDQRIEVFFNKDKAYIVGCGDYLVYGSWGGDYQLRRVIGNEDTYIPTTTIGIGGATQASLDEVNCLSKYRKNKMIGDDRSSFVRKLDTSVDENTLINIEIEYSDKKLIIQNPYRDIDEETDYITKDGLCVMKLQNGEYVVDSSYGQRYTPYGHDDRVGKVDYSTGCITLYVESSPSIPKPIPPVSGEDNITVTFEHRREDYEKRIINCNFGVPFGTDGNSDRLFVSGNSDYPHYDFHTATDDYTYFEDTNTAVLGSDSVPITGYARLSDSTLAVFKSATNQESTIYYRNGKYLDKYDSQGNPVYLKGVFPTTAGSIGEGCVSRYACANFGGDNIMLSSNGVFGIVLGENITTNERYTKDRSETINRELEKHNLSEAVAIVYRGKYYLAVDGICFVADSRYRHTTVDSYAYEWWYLDNMPVRVWAVIGEELYFGSADGMLCVFDEEYTDRTFTQTAEGELSLNAANGTITYSNNVEIHEDEEVRIETEGVYARVAYCTPNDDYYFYYRYKTDDIAKLHEGDGVCISYEDYDGTEYEEGYTVSDIDPSDKTFYLMKDGVSDNRRLNITLYVKYSNTSLYACEAANNTFKLRPNKLGDALDIASFGDVPSLPTMKIIHKKNVVAEWYTPYLDLGTYEYGKTLLKISVSTDPEATGKLSFGYETRISKKMQGLQGKGAFSFNDTDFSDFTFDTGFANSYTVRCNERNFNYIMFKFVSVDDKCCIVNSFEVQYRINSENKGVR